MATTVYFRSNSVRTLLQWSNCSLVSLAASFVHGGLACLQNVPGNSSDRVVYCGDGVVEGKEQCDCGMIENCNNPCCDAEKCVMHKNATCASGPCCNLDVSYIYLLKFKIRNFFSK